ncbi:RAD55 family ATPase [Geoglobus sp.]
MFITGIEAVDRHGGLRPGLIYVLESPGAGGREFAYSVLFRNSQANPRVITLTSTAEEIRREVELTYPGMADRFENLMVESLAHLYFRDSIVPLAWVSRENRILLKKEGSFLEGLVRAFDSLPDHSVAILDSVTDLVRMSRRGIEWADIVDLMLGVRKLCVKKNGLTLALLTSGVLGSGEQNELLAGSDGIIVFEWVDEKSGLSRWVHFRKLIGIMEYLEMEKISRFRIRVDPHSGFTVTQYERVI